MVETKVVGYRRGNSMVTLDLTLNAFFKYLIRVWPPHLNKVAPVLFKLLKYIEDVLKTRGLRKSLNFLDRLHTSVLRKARLALERSKVPSEEDAYFQEEYEGDQELRRYGMWSPEAKSLNLPSYR
ncbi:hypothetical protein TSAR_011184 [Trichomalopsis sarcophagae]|uniref:Uncharacterized protein n=1 Tax=Trichomalopsis sarcophagae TaxID=543379 RepID=A0A232F407_9HYME|nr:hypothetical protein TSAR_011184 [Trichomalopsis sarcophagae]